MKKILISILVVLLAMLTYFLMLEDIKIARWKNKSINDIKSLNKQLEEQIKVSTQANNQEYPASIDKIEESIKNLKIAKEKYDNKMKYLSENVELGIVQVKEYKIERLWIVLENYAKDENVELKLDILDNAKSDTYDLDITVIGSYIGITDFIYDIEKDDTLGFKILNFKLAPNSTVQESNTNDSNKTVQVDTSKLKATFKIQNVGIEFN